MAKDMILVVGSINMDLVVRAAEMPGPGQTVLGNGFQTSFGGKGANQAVAVSRLGGKCRMIGSVGDDPFGQALRANLEKEGVDCTAVTTSVNEPSGVAMIVVDSNGENSIVVASGANFAVSPDDHVFPNEQLFAQAAILMLQLELPLPTVRAAMELGRRHGCRIIMDPAPAPLSLPDDLCNVDVMTPNEVEAERITGTTFGEEAQDKLLASDLIAKGAKNVVLKLGARGSLVVMGDGHFYTVAPYKVKVVDTTAAGDAFTGGLAVGLAKGMKLREAACLASAAGALACTRMGAQAAMPTAEEVAALMKTEKPC